MNRLIVCLISAFAISYAANTLDEMPYEERFENIEVELLVSYKLVSKNHLAERESYTVSRVMNNQTDKAYKVVGKCEIDASRYYIMDDMPYFIAFILKQEKEQMLECLFGYEVLIRESTSGRDNTISSRTRLEIAPTRIRARLLDKNIIVHIVAKEHV